MAELDGKKVAILATNYFEETELTGPLEGLKKLGAEVHVIAPETGELQAVKGDVNQTITVPVDKTIGDARPQDYDAVVIPGGVINADHLRTHEDAQVFVQMMDEDEKIIAAICHGPWLLVSAQLVDGLRMTSYPSLRDDIENAGGEWVDEEVVVDDNFITSRKPADIPTFTGAIISALGK